MSPLQRLDRTCAQAGLLLVRLYRRCISPFLPACCRFEPTCSAYAVEALRTHGFLHGTGLIVWRLLRCHPFYHGPLYDPVPQNPRKGSR